MSLQLYQVDYRSYLLDFKSVSDENENPNRGNLIICLNYSLLVILIII